MSCCRDTFLESADDLIGEPGRGQMVVKAVKSGRILSEMPMAVNETVFVASGSVRAEVIDQWEMGESTSWRPDVGAAFATGLGYIGDRLGLFTA